VFSRRVNLRKVVDGPMELDPVIAEVLAAPVAKERALLDAVRASGGDESVEKAAAGAARCLDAVRDAYGGELPETVRKAAEDLAGTPSKLTPAPAPASVAQEEKTVTKHRSGSEILRDVERFAKETERYHDERAEQRIEAAAERVRKASGYRLSKAQAAAKALEDDPELYASYHRHQLRKSGALDDHPNGLEKADGMQTALDRAADAVLAREPNLTHAQAVTKALEENPRLYEEAR